MQETGRNIPVMVSGTIEPMGTMLAGQTAEALLASIAHADLLAIGLNCATGPEFMTDHVRSLTSMAPVRVSCYPNAGLPNEDGLYLETPDSLAAQLERFVKHGWLNIVGGCCGTTDKHIAAIAEMAEGRSRAPLKAPAHRAYYSGIDCRRSRRQQRARSSSASAPTSSVRACSRTSSPKKSGKKPSRSPAARSRTARTSSMSASSRPTATRSRTSRPSTRS